MRIFVFEYITGGGLLPAAGAAETVREFSSRRLDHDLLAEGRAMVRALASDFAAIADCDIHILRDCDVTLALPPGVRAHTVHDGAEYLAAFVEQAAVADWTVVNAADVDLCCSPPTSRTTRAS